jgi:DNA-binding response OmpR family regulator
MLSDERAAREAGCDDYLTKPISSALLLAAVSKFVRQPAAGARPVTASGAANE